MISCHNEKCHEKNGLVVLIQDDTDDRQEWCIQYYHCPECNTSYERRIDYKTQSSLIERDTLYTINEKGEHIEVE